MACPTCDHTMAQVPPPHFHCPRCGTIKYGNTNCLKTELAYAVTQFALAVKEYPPSSVGLKNYADDILKMVTKDKDNAHPRKE